MKVICPKCGISGFLQQRGESCRIQHYIGFKERKRIYQYHNVKLVEANGSKSMEVKKPANDTLCEKWCGERDSNPRTPTGQPPQGKRILKTSFKLTGNCLNLGFSRSIYQLPQKTGLVMQQNTLIV